jgi:hypothetical protein
MTVCYRKIFSKISSLNALYTNFSSASALIRTPDYKAIYFDRSPVDFWTEYTWLRVRTIGGLL